MNAVPRERQPVRRAPRKSRDWLAGYAAGSAFAEATIMRLRKQLEAVAGTQRAAFPCVNDDDCWVR